MMNKLLDCINNKNISVTPIWFMRQAGRYLPEFREIRKKNTDFIKLCLNSDLVKEITIQPLKRFEIDAAIIFSDILIIPYGLGQEVNFKKGYGPSLGELKLENIIKTKDINFIEKTKPVYEGIKKVKKELKNKDLIGFVGAPWTLLLYMINKQSPKLNLKNDFFKDDFLIKKLLIILEKFLKVHIKNQIDNGADIIQIFDSWAGLLDKKDLPSYVYNPTLNLVEFVKTLKVPVICFPRAIKDYKNYCEIVKPDAICIDYEVDPIKISKEITIPIQGGLDPKVLLTDKDNLGKEIKKYLNIFKDYPYIFNLGHGILPETDPNMVDYLVKTIKNY